VPHTACSENPIDPEEDEIVRLALAEVSSPGNTVKIKPTWHDVIDRKIDVLAQTMLECGAKIILPTDGASMSFRYCVHSDSEWIQVPLRFLEEPELPTSLYVLRLSFLNKYSQLDSLLQNRPKMADDVLRTALFLTCRGDHYQAANVLLSHGAQPDWRDSNGDPCLVVASRYNSEQLVRVLLESGADVDITDSVGYTSWSHICGLQSHDAVASVLFDAGTKKNVNGSCKVNPLHIAAYNGQADEVRVMLKRGMDPSFATYLGWHPVVSRICTPI
jgi:hypothetical protein